MPGESFFMINEIRDTPNALNWISRNIESIQDVAELITNKGIEKLFFIGCGSSYYAAMHGIYHLIGSKFEVYSLPSSEFLFYYKRGIDNKTAVIALSRSGNTAETVTAMREARSKEALTIGFTCTKGSMLDREADKSLVIDIGEEKSIIMTKSFTSLSIVTSILSMILSSKINSYRDEIKKLKEISENILKIENKIKEKASEKINIERFVFLGQGPTYPTVLEGALKLKETSYIASEGLHALEFRHGPMSSIGEKLTINALMVKGESHSAVNTLIEEIVNKGADVTVFTNSDSVDLGEVIKIPSELSEELSAILFIIPLQLFAFYYSTGKGINPDSPRHLSKYIAKF